MKQFFTLLFIACLLNIGFAQNNTWTWVNGNNTNFQRGVYGTKGVAASANLPGSRGASVTWKDKSGNFWLFGGQAYDVNGNNGFMNDLWKWDGTNWTWISGSSVANPSGVYGTKGVPSTNNVPPGKTNSIGWIDNNDNLWLFGGQGNTSNYMNDLWKWDGANWTWISGNSTANTVGVYGTQGAPNANNVPGARESSTAWTDNNGNFWLFGGDNAQGAYNDLWKWDGANWTWFNGQSISNQNGSYGAKGVTTSSNLPGARNLAMNWKDTSGNFWLFGGYGYPAGSGSYNPLNDLWKWDGSNWTWVSGSSTSVAAGVYGTKNIASSSNIPGARWGATNWVDKSGNFWLWGGHGRDQNGNDGVLNDLWKWDGTNWTWISGSTINAQSGVYGTKGAASANNTPGARADAFSWIDNTGNLFLFGGFYWNDLWKFDLSSSVLPITITSFNGILVDKKTKLYWSTANEINNAGFYLERSVDANRFTTIGFIAGQGTTSQSTNYTFIDSLPLTGKNYYRFKQTDINGHFTYSSVIVVNNVTDETGTIKVYPSPATNYINVALQNISGSLQILNLMGQPVKTTVITANNMKIDIGNLPLGTYVCKANGLSVLFVKQ